MPNQVFPIHTKTSCLLKWGWSTIFLDKATTNSCHRCARHEFDIDNFKSFHNTDIKLANRESMLNGEWPQQGCAYCRQQEESGGISDRQFQLMEQHDSKLTPPELRENPLSKNVTPTMLEIYFRNVCNQKCIYCTPGESNLWEQEIKQYGDISNLNPRLKIKNTRSSLSADDYGRALSNMWKYLDEIYIHLRRFGVVGGEPFLQQKEMDQSIDFWAEHPNPDLVFYVISNLNLPEKVMTRYYERFRWLIENSKVWKVQITASLDGWGKEQEYTRFGLDLLNWQRNFENLVQQSWPTVSINSAVSALTIHTMPVLMEKINYWNKIRPIGTEPIIYSFNTTTNTPEDPIIFGAGIFEESFDQVLDLMPDETESDRNIKSYMDSIKKKISVAPKQSDKIANLKKYLDELDRRRGTDWRATFPWLVEIE